MKKYTLTNWTMENHQSIFGAFVLRGLIQGHPTLADGTEVRTTAVTSMDNEQGIAYTHHSGCFAISTATMSPDWAAQLTSGGSPIESFLQDSFEVAPFQDDGDSVSALASALGLGDADSDPTDDTQDLAGDGSNDGLNGDNDSPDLGGLPPGLADLLASLGAGDDDGVGADNDAIPTPKRRSRAKASA